MKIINLIEFITEGRLSSIQIGSTKSHVKRGIGKPAESKKLKFTSDNKNNNWQYNDLSIEFDKSTELVTVISFHSKVSRDPSIGKAIIETSHIKFGMQIGDFELVMKEPDNQKNEKYNGVKYQSDYYGWEIEFNSGVVVYFKGKNSGVAPLVEIATRTYNQRLNSASKYKKT